MKIRESYEELHDEITCAIAGSLLIVIILNETGGLDRLEMQALIGVGSLMVFSYIPFAIQALGSHKSVFKWDKKVLLDQVTDIPGFIIWVFCLAGPIFFWRVFPSVKYLLLWVFLSGVAGIALSMVRVYRWQYDLEKRHSGRSYVTEIRLKYIRGLSIQEMITVWDTDTWINMHKLSRADCIGLVNQFTATITDLPMPSSHKPNKPSKQVEGASMFSGLVGCFHEIQLKDYTVYERLLTFTMQQCQVLSVNARKRQYTGWFKAQTDILLLHIIDVFFFKKHGLDPYLLFEIVQRYSEKEKIDESLMYIIAHRLFEVIDELERSEVLSYLDLGESFPNQWKVNVKNLKSNEQIIRAWFMEYRDWAQHRVVKDKGITSKNGLHHQAVLATLFADLDVHLLLNMMTLQLYPYDYVSRPVDEPEVTRIKAFIEDSRLQLVSYVGTWRGGDGEKAHKDRLIQGEDEVLTINRIIRPFPIFQDTELLEKLMQITHKLTYKKGSKEQTRKETLLKVLEVVKNSLDG